MYSKGALRVPPARRDPKSYNTEYNGSLSGVRYCVKESSVELESFGGGATSRVGARARSLWDSGHHRHFTVSQRVIAKREAKANPLQNSPRASALSGGYATGRCPCGGLLLVSFIFSIRISHVSLVLGSRLSLSLRSHMSEMSWCRKQKSSRLHRGGCTSKARTRRHRDPPLNWRPCKRGRVLRREFH